MDDEDRMLDELLGVVDSVAGAAVERIVAPVDGVRAVRAAARLRGSRRGGAERRSLGNGELDAVLRVMRRLDFTDVEHNPRG